MISVELATRHARLYNCAGTGPDLVMVCVVISHDILELMMCRASAVHFRLCLLFFLRQNSVDAGLANSALWLKVMNANDILCYLGCCNLMSLVK